MNTCPSILLLSAVILLSSTHGNQWRLAISPPEVTTISHDGSMSIFCQTQPPQALVECAFQIAPLTPSEPLFVETKRPSAEYWNLTVNYDGKSLSEGLCRLELLASTQYKEESFSVGCRVRTEGGGWVYGYTSIVDTLCLPKEISLRTEPKDTFLLPGSNLTLRCDSANNDSLESCSFKLPRTEKFDLAPMQSNEGFQYVGDGLDKGQCGIFVPNISQVVSDTEDVITCETYINWRKIPTRDVRITIARCSSDPMSLKMSFTTPGNGTEKAVELRCVAPSCRPPAAILWYLNGTLVTGGNVSEEPVDKWRWRSDMETTTQVLRMDYVEEIQGQTVECVVEHAAFKNSESIEILSPGTSWPGWMIGVVIVSVVSAVLIIAALVTLFAKRTNRWCFPRQPNHRMDLR